MERADLVCVFNDNVLTECWIDRDDQFAIEIDTNRDLAHVPNVIESSTLEISASRLVPVSRVWQRARDGDRLR